MRVLISADIEGASGIVRGREIGYGRHVSVDPESSPDYLAGRRWLTADINAAIEGALQGGATSFVVHDTHGHDYGNVDLETLHPAVRVVRGMPLIFFEFEDLATSSYDAAFLIGMHARAGEPGVLSHVLDWPVLYDVRINGRPVGESEITAALAGYYGIPTVLVSGDHLVCEQVAAWANGLIETAVVKRAVSRYAANCLPLGVAREVIREGARRAMQRVGSTPPCAFEPPITLQVTTLDRQVARYVSWMPGLEYDGNCTVSYTSDDFLAIYKALLAMFWILESGLNP